MTQVVSLLQKVDNGNAKLHQEERPTWTTAPHHNIRPEENHESIKREEEILAYRNYKSYNLVSHVAR